jgi:hypothetical protein
MEKLGDVLFDGGVCLLFGLGSLALMFGAYALVLSRKAWREAWGIEDSVGEHAERPNPL